MEDNENYIEKVYFQEQSSENENNTFANILNSDYESSQQESSINKIASFPQSSLKTFEEILNDLNDIKIPYPNDDEIPLIKIKDENHFENGNDIDSYNKYLVEIVKNKYDNKFNICRQCKKQQNKYFCQKCNQNICNICSKICLNKNHILIELKNYLEEFEQIKSNTYSIISNYVINNGTQTFESNNNNDEKSMKYSNDIILILAINKQKYINYFHYINIKECLYYLRNKYKNNIGYIIANYNINENETKIKIFGNKFIMNNRNICNIIYEDINYDLREFIELKNIRRKELLEIKLIGINNIIDASYMFSGCDSLNSLSNLSEWNTINITDMSYMFSWCEYLISLPDISKWNTNKVTNMSCMFWGCKSLISIPDISKWITNNVKDMSFMFSECESLKSLPDISEWNTNNVIDMSSMFSKSISLTSLPNISKWNLKNEKDMSYIHYECKSLKLLPDISFNNKKTSFRYNIVENNLNKVFDFNPLGSNIKKFTEPPKITINNIIPYPNNNEIPLIKIEDENYFENGNNIISYIKSLVEFDDNKFNICKQCNKGENKLYCKYCIQNICDECYKKCKPKNHELTDLKDYLKECEEDRRNIYELITENFLLTKKNQNLSGLEKENKIMK